MSDLKSPLRWPGGKSKQASFIFDRFPPSPKRYIEPMVGGGSLFIYAKQKNFAQEYWINDLYEPLVDFWSCLRSPFFSKNLQEACEFLLSPTDTIRRNNMDNLPLMMIDENIRDGYKLFWRNRCSFSGSTFSGGLSPSAGTGDKNDRFTRSSFAHLTEFPDLLKGTKISNLPVFEVLAEAGDGDFLYIDPPYYTAKKLYGKSGNMHDFDHERLANQLKETKAKFLLSYDSCATIKDLYRWARIEEVTFNRSMSKAKTGAELLISNYEENTI